MLDITCMLYIGGQCRDVYVSHNGRLISRTWCTASVVWPRHAWRKYGNATDSNEVARKRCNIKTPFHVQCSHYIKTRLLLKSWPLYYGLISMCWEGRISGLILYENMFNINMVNSTNWISIPKDIALAKPDFCVLLSILKWQSPGLWLELIS